MNTWPTSQTIYRCPDCGHECTENDMEEDYSWAEFDGESEDVWSSHICPNCGCWWNLEDWAEVRRENR